MNKKLRVSFVIPFTGMTGGIAVVLEYRRQLTALGHEVDIFYPLLPYRAFFNDKPRWKRLPSRIKQLLRNLTDIKRAIPLFSENIPVKPLFRINNSGLPDADAIIATAWPTAYDVAGLSPKKGKKYYLVQGYEIWQGCVDTVDNSYRLPLNIITVAPWLTDLMKSKFNRDDVTEIRSGVRPDKFYPPNVKNFNQPSILMMASELELKGVKDGIDALTAVKERYPQLNVTMFGMCGKPSAPFDFEYRQNPPYETLLSLYQNAAIFIFPSHNEDGWGLTPIEAMACKCAVVATNVGCIPVINNGKNLILAEVKNPASIADAVVKLLEDKELTEKTAEHGLESVRTLDWAAAARKLLDSLASPRQKT
jgi:glycosyltransferase involved in cell wall biosynthesis